MPALDPLSHAPDVMPVPTESQILRFAQNDRGHAMTMHGIIPVIP